MRCPPRRTVDTDAPFSHGPLNQRLGHRGGKQSSMLARTSAGGFSPRLTLGGVSGAGLSVGSTVWLVRTCETRGSVAHASHLARALRACGWVATLFLQLPSPQGALPPAWLSRTAKPPAGPRGCAVEEAVVGRRCRGVCHGPSSASPAQVRPPLWQRSSRFPTCLSGVPTVLKAFVLRFIAKLTL